MSSPFVTFRPADYYKGKDSFVFFYALNPAVNKLERKKIRLNHIKRKAERDKYARFLCHKINEKLFSGWNPFAEKLSAQTVTILAGIDKFMEAKQKSSREATMRSYRSFAGMFRTWLESNNHSSVFCSMADRAFLISYLDWADLTKTLSNRSYNNYGMFLYTLFEFFMQRGWIKENPASDLPKRKVNGKERTIIPKDVRARIKEYFLAETPNYYYVMQLCYRLFIRPHEISMLRIGDIDFENRLLIIHSEVAKNHNSRVLGVPDDIMAYFETLKEKPAIWYIFADRNTYNPGPKKMASTRIAERWKIMRDKLKLPASYQFYSLKDTGITEMLEAGVPAKYVKELADHHSLEMTERYTHKSSAKKILEWNRLEF